MKKFGLHIVGAFLVSSLQVGAAVPYKKRRSFDCYSDKKLSSHSKRADANVSEFEVVVSDMDDNQAQFVIKRNYIGKNGTVKTESMNNEIANVENSQKYLTIQGREWALAIAPLKKRASLYNMNPDINEVPMFCLSQ